MADWTETHRPRTLREIRGNDSACEELRDWAETWDDHREAVVLHGSPGVGKTSAAHALAADMGWETVELNASDSRTADDIERFAGRAARNATLGGSAGRADGAAAGDAAAGRQLVVLDEADNVHGNYDRGGSRAITRLVKESGQPVVLIANDYYELSRGLRSATREIEFRDVAPRSIVPALRDICRREDLEFEAEALERIAQRNPGDLRGAVNDLQAAAGGRDRITLDAVVTGDRDRGMGLFPFLDAVLKEEPSAREALEASYGVDETPDDLTAWIEHNLLKAYDPDEATRAYEFLANADRWLGRVRATQEYGYWRYAADDAVAGVAAARDGTTGGWTRWSRPQFWASTDDTVERIVRTIAERGGFSMGTVRRAVLPFLSAMIHHCKPRDLTVAVAAAYDLDEAGVAAITGSGESTNKVESIVADAAALREERMAAHAEGAFATPAEPAGDDPDSDPDPADADADPDPDPDADATDGSPTTGDAGDGPGTGSGDGTDSRAEDDEAQAGLGDFV